MTKLLNFMINKGHCASIIAAQKIFA